MKSKFSSFLKVIPVYLKKVRYNKNVGVFLIFLLLSTIFWFLNELEDAYVTEISYPVKYTDPPDNQVFVGNLPEHLELEIEGTGFKLLEFKIGKDLMPIEFSVNSYDLQTESKKKNDKYFIQTNSIRDRLAQQLSSDLNILDISPDTLFFQFANKATKKVPVVSQLEYSFGKQLMLKGKVSIEPDSLTISGPSTVLDTIESVKTVTKNFSEISETMVQSVSLQKTHPQLQYSEKKVKVEIPVEQFTEGEVRKEIEIKNLPDSVLLRTFPEYVQITYLVGLSNYENVIPELFKVSVNYNDVRKDVEKIPVKVEKAPDYLKSYSYSPHKVDYIIEKRND